MVGLGSHLIEIVMEYVGRAQNHITQRHVDQAVTSNLMHHQPLQLVKMKVRKLILVVSNSYS